VTGHGTIGFSTPVLANTVIQAMVRGFAATAAARGGHLLATDATLDAAKQAHDIARLTDCGVDALLVYPAGEPSRLREALDAAVARGIVVFAHDDVGHPEVVGELVTPVERMGALAADLLAERLGGQGTVAIVGGVPAPAILDRIAGFRRRLAARYPGLEVVAEIENKLDAEPGAEAVTKELVAGGVSPDGFFGYNDASAIGAARAAYAAGLHPVVVGNNAEPHGIAALREGIVAATVDRHPVELAVRGAELILDVLEGRLGRVPHRHRVEVEPTPVRASEADSFVPWEQRCSEPPPGSWEILEA
jgi:ABC-type sugar transport system substrate-binding protein